MGGVPRLFLECAMSREKVSTSAVMKNQTGKALRKVSTSAVIKNQTERHLAHPLDVGGVPCAMVVVLRKAKGRNVVACNGTSGSTIEVLPPILASKFEVVPYQVCCPIHHTAVLHLLLMNLDG
jgi:hypothetical protein